MAWNVLVHNGVLQLHDPGSAATFLISQPPGVYTTTRSTNNASCLLLWDRHLARLSQSLKLLSIEMPQLFPNDPARLPAFKDILQPSLKTALQTALQVRRDNEELIITSFVCGSGGIQKFETMTEVTCKEHKGFDIYVHVSSYPSDRQGSAANIAHLAVMGSGRSLPNVKHSEWVRARQVLEQSRPMGVTELILSNDGDSLLEGMVSNFFVVLSPRTDKAPGHSFEVDGKESWEEIVIQTAPLEGVLPGVIRQLIFEICTEEGICIEQVPPSWKNRHMWKEAFITSSIRFVQSVGSIRCPNHWDCRSEPESLQEKSWEDLNLQAPGHFTRTIQDRVWNKSLKCSVTIDSLLRD